MDKDDFSAQANQTAQEGIASIRTVQVLSDPRLVMMTLKKNVPP